MNENDMCYCYSPDVSTIMLLVCVLSLNLQPSRDIKQTSLQRFAFSGCFSSVLLVLHNLFARVAGRVLRL